MTNKIEKLQLDTLPITRAQLERLDGGGDALTRPQDTAIPPEHLRLIAGALQEFYDYGYDRRKCENILALIPDAYKGE